MLRTYGRNPDVNQIHAAHHLSPLWDFLLLRPAHAILPIGPFDAGSETCQQSAPVGQPWRSPLRGICWDPLQGDQTYHPLHRCIIPGTREPYSTLWNLHNPRLRSLTYVLDSPELPETHNVRL